MPTYAEIKEDLNNMPDVSLEDDDKESKLPTIFNTALAAFTVDVPNLASYTIPANSLVNTLSADGSNIVDDFVSVDGEYIISGAGRSYYFKVSGNGSFSVTDEDGERDAESFSSKEFIEFRGFINGETSIRFFGEFLFFVKDIAIYEAIYSNDPKDIPAFACFVEYDFRELTKELLDSEDPEIGYWYPFQSFSPEKFQYKTGEGYVSLTDYRIEPDETGTILVVNGFDRTEKKIYYRRNYPRLSSSSKDELLIDIPQQDYGIFLYLLVELYNMDENEISVERAAYMYDVLTAGKKQLPSGKNVTGNILNTKGY